ncbi:MAG: GtrA family protein [Clostridia bacterium]|jgi:gtrA-like protein./bacterial membrane protein yfhO
MDKLKKLLNREVIFYIIFGVLTTLVNIIASYILKAFLHVEANIASTIGIILSILFAYFTNRKWVFNSQANTIKEKWTEFFKFILGRAFTMVVEIIGVFLLNDVLHAFYNFGDNIGFLIDKCIITVIVIILNFFISKFFAFKKK